MPDVTALGEPDAAGVEAYLHRLDRVEAALGTVYTAYSSALARRDDLAGQIEGYAAKAAGLPEPIAADVAELTASARAVLAATPVHLDRLAALAAAQQGYVTAYERAEHPSEGRS